MTTIRLIGILISNLPELIRIVELLEKRAQEGATNAKIKEDLQTIESAFKNKDAEALRNLFNS